MVYVLIFGNLVDIVIVYSIKVFSISVYEIFKELLEWFYLF